MEITVDYLKDKVHEQYLELQELRKSYDELTKSALRLNEIVNEQSKEIERLNNIINELEKELDLNLPFKVIGVRGLKNKIKELKGVDKE